MCNGGALSSLSFSGSIVLVVFAFVVGAALCEQGRELTMLLLFVRRRVFFSTASAL
jgi:hypothetical protein